MNNNTFGYNQFLEDSTRKTFLLTQMNIQFDVLIQILSKWIGWSNVLKLIDWVNSRISRISTSFFVCWLLNTSDGYSFFVFRKHSLIITSFAFHFLPLDDSEWFINFSNYSRITYSQTNGLLIKYAMTIFQQYLNVYLFNFCICHHFEFNWWNLRCNYQWIGEKKEKSLSTVEY